MIKPEAFTKPQRSKACQDIYFKPELEPVAVGQQALREFWARDAFASLELSKNALLRSVVGGLPGLWVWSLPCNTGCRRRCGANP